MSAADDSTVPKPWENEDIDPVFPDLLGGNEISLPEDVFERILTIAMDPSSEAADESLIPLDDDPVLTDEGAFTNPEDAELFLETSGIERDEEEDSEPDSELGGEGRSDADNDGLFGTDEFTNGGLGDSFDANDAAQDDSFGGQWS